MTILRASILGGVDGVITSFAIVAGSSAASFDRHTVLVVGTSSVLADGLSMGVSEYLSSTSERAASGARGRARPLVLGVACFASFVACGFVPIVVFLLGGQSLLACAMFALVELMLLGSGRTLFTSEPLLAGLVQTTTLGSLAGATAYGVGRLVHGAGG